MACLHMKKKLSEYLDGALGAEEVAYVEEHVSTCEDCAATLSELRATLSHVGSLEEVEPPPWFTEKVMQRINKEAGRKSILRRLFFPLHIKIPAEAVALVLVAVVAVYVFDAVEPEMAVNQASVPEQKGVVVESVAEAPEAETFHNPTDEKGKPFAPATTVSKPEEDAVWEREDIGREPAAMEFAAKEKAMLRDEVRNTADDLRKPEAVTEDVLGGAPAPAAPEEQAMMDRVYEGESFYAREAKVQPEPNMRLSVEVEDVDFARHEIEDAIRGLGGKIIDEKEQAENIVLAEIASDKADRLIEAIAEVGEIKSKVFTTGGERISVRIELSESAGP